MRLIESIIKNDYKTISIIGMAKNAGKTVTLNYLIQKSHEKKISIGITSTGRDGESVDLVTQTHKPTIYVFENTYVATAKKTLSLSDAKVEILETTGINTPMGEVVIIRVRQSGNVQIAGPVSTHDIKYVCERLKYYGAKVVFVDGAIDRKAASSPVITDACIISTGAVLHRDMKKTIEQTVQVVESYNLRQVDEEIKHLILRYNKTCVIQKTGEVVEPDINTNIASGKKISELLDENTAYVFLKGAVTSILLKDLIENKHIKNIAVIVEDGTKIFAKNLWHELMYKGMKIFVLNKIYVAAVTLNPASPAGYFYDSKEFYNKMKSCLPNIKIIDVVSGGDEN